MASVKKCCQCREYKPYTEFSKDNSRRDGHQPRCKDCQREYYRANKKRLHKKNAKYYHDNKDAISEQRKQHYRENREQILEKNRQWFADNPDRTKEYKHEWYIENKVRHRANGRRWERKNRDRVSGYGKKWRRNNPDKNRIKSMRYRARKNGATTKAYDFDAICDKYGNKCLRCGSETAKLTIDHVIPLSRNGNDVASNIQPLCKSCNSAKGAKTKDYRVVGGVPSQVLM